MKTTIEISDGLVEEGLRKVIADKRQTGEFRLRRASFKGRGLQPQVREMNRDRLRDMANEGRGG
jgi:hypothetical protein